MTERLILITALFLIFYHISGLATTNILRLTAGNQLPVLASQCCCDHCGASIPPLLQLPVISYLLCRGKCRSCGAQIPVFPLLLELTVLAGRFGVTMLLGCTYLAVSLSFLFYELVRVVVVIRLGKRQKQFARQYGIAVAAMIPFYVLTLVIPLLYAIV